MEVDEKEAGGGNLLRLSNSLKSWSLSLRLRGTLCSPGVSAEVLRHMELQRLPPLQGVQGNQRTKETIIVQETMLSLKASSLKTDEKANN